VKEVLRIRPVLTITPRKVMRPFELGGWTLPPGVHVTPCIYLAHRRPELWPEPTAFRPERFLDGAPAPYSWLPFGGGVRRCAGAAFATMELHEVLRAVSRRFELRPDRPDGERMRRRGVTLAPSRGGRVVPLAWT
jgi:cytochrome P450 family 135